MRWKRNHLEHYSKEETVLNDHGWDWNIRKFMDDEEVNAVIIFAKDIFRVKIKKMGITENEIKQMKFL